MDKSALCGILFKWFQTFEVEAKVKKLDDLTDGVAMAQALHEIAPEWFTDHWLSKIKTDTGGNWRLKVSNLKKVLEKVLDYYQECFNQTLGGFVKPDVLKIGDMGDPSEIGKLLQLILGCAVNCKNKEDYIKRIMAMQESDQRVMMECIQELDSGGGALSFSAASLAVEPQVEHLVMELNAVKLAKDQMEQRCLELDMQVSQLHEEKLALMEEKNRLMDQVQSSIESASSGGPLRRQVDALKEELFKMETSKDDYRLKLEMQEKDMVELQAKVEELQKTAAEARILKDELDILRETADKVDKYEATLQSYKKKLEESGDLKRELKLLEAKNLNYIQQNMELEEELKKSGAWKAQVEAYKKQVSELHDKLIEETKRADKLHYEVKSASDKLSAALKEKERLILERDSLREANEEMKCLQLQMSGSETTLMNAPMNSVSEGLVSTTELRQQIVRLQHENNMLKLQQKNPEEDHDSLSVVQNLLDDARAQIDKMWKENREANQKIIQLEGELKEINERGEEGALGARNRFLELQQQLQRDRQKYSIELEEKETLIAENKQVIALMQEKLNQKEMELQELDDKHKKYVEKARSVAKAIDPSIFVNTQELSILRSQLSESQKSLKELEEARSSRECESKLLATAFNSWATSKQRDSVEKRLASLGPTNSFIGRVRQPLSKKLNTCNSK